MGEPSKRSAGAPFAKDGAGRILEGDPVKLYRPDADRTIVPSCGATSDGAPVRKGDHPPLQDQSVSLGGRDRGLIVDGPDNVVVRSAVAPPKPRTVRLENRSQSH